MLLNLKELVIKHNLNIKGVLQIGAHYGEENIVYDELNIKNRVFFEPVQANFDRLQSQCKGYTCYNVALGNTRGTVAINIEEANNGQSCSILEPALHLKQYPHIKFNKQEMVTITKLDGVAFTREDHNFINMDVQGYELEVLKGGYRTLRYIDYIMTEVNRAELYKDCCKIEELDLFLKNYGFNRVEVNWAGHTWGDAFYVKG